MRLSIVLCLAIAACRPSPARLEMAISDCRVRARAGAGDYDAAFQVCLTDQAKLGHQLAQDFGTAEGWRMRALGQETLSMRWSNYAVYTSYMRLARFHGADSIWLEKTITTDSTALASIP